MTQSHSRRKDLMDLLGFTLGQLRKPEVPLPDGFKFKSLEVSPVTQCLPPMRKDGTRTGSPGTDYCQFALDIGFSDDRDEHTWHYGSLVQIHFDQLDGADSAGAFVELVRHRLAFAAADLSDVISWEQGNAPE